MESFEGRVAFITGGAQGIGLGIARAFARAGARLALADIDEPALSAARAELASLTTVKTYALDVRDRETYAGIADEAEAELGPVTLLCNNAGVGGEPDVTEMTYAVWDLIIGIDLGGVINGVQTFLPRMLSRGERGHIVNTASAAGLAVTTGEQYIYHTAKYGVVGLSEALRGQLEPHGIGVTVACPGLVATNVLESSRAAAPAGADPTDSGRFAVLQAALAKFGLDPSVVGDMVLAGVRDNALYVHTDRMIEGAIQARTHGLLAALPAETERDRELGAAIAELRAQHGALWRKSEQG